MMVWLFTFLIHSTLWCGVAWLGLRAFPNTHARLRETVWYMALAASLITPTVRLVTSPDVAAWRLPMPSFIAGAEHESRAEPGHRNEAGSALRPAAGEAHRETHAADPNRQALAGILWLLPAAALLALYLLRLMELRRGIRDREPVTDVRASRALAALGRRAALAPPPGLTQSHNLGSPVALGVGARREICVPVRALHELDEGELHALLGHEVAHHLRRDTIRLAILQVTQAVFFCQPLFRLAVRELRLAAEELCDDWAANQSGDPFAMASCLTEVARWVVRRDRYSPVPCIGRRRSLLERRVRRLMNDHCSLQVPPRSWRRMSAVGFVALAPLLAPAVVPGADVSHEERAGLDGSWLGEHQRPRAREIRERREHGRGSSAQGARPLSHDESGVTDTSLSADLDRDGT